MKGFRFFSKRGGSEEPRMTSPEVKVQEAPELQEVTDSKVVVEQVRQASTALLSAVEVFSKGFMPSQTFPVELQDSLQAIKNHSAFFAGESFRSRNINISQELIGLIEKLKLPPTEELQVISTRYQNVQQNDIQRIQKMRDAVYRTFINLDSDLKLLSNALDKVR